MSPDKILYTGTATAIGGPTGTARSSDGSLDVTLSTVRELGGNGTPGTNPEQLFAAGYSACFIGAIKAVAAGMTGEPKIVLPGEVSITSDVGIGQIPGGFGIKVTMRISIPGLDKATAEELVAKAHQVCPYSNATRGNIDVSQTVV